MAAHFAALSAQSTAAYVGDRQGAWLTAMHREHDNLRAAFEWAVSSRDAETALTIAGGASWPHWLSGAVAEGKRWLDDAFACGGEADPRTCALALAGRGLLNFLSGAPEPADADLLAALETFRASGDVASLAMTYSFYAEVAAVGPDIDEARRRRAELLAFYRGLPDDPFTGAARAYSEAKLAALEGDLVRAEHHYRDAAARFGPIGRPVMYSMCLGIVADFDERAGDYDAAIADLEAAVETDDALGLGGFTGALVARLGWVLLQRGDVGHAEAMYERSIDAARWAGNAPVLLLSLVGSAALHRVRRHDVAAEAAATEALTLYLSGSSQRFRNRIDPLSEVRAGAATCCAVLGMLAASTRRRRRGGPVPGPCGPPPRRRRGHGPHVPTRRHHSCVRRHGRRPRRRRVRRRLRARATGHARGPPGAGARRRRLIRRAHRAQRARPEVSGRADDGAVPPMGHRPHPTARSRRRRRRPRPAARTEHLR